MYISAPPGDSIVQAREHFQEYIKPILVAAALDWDAVEGRREGDVRAGLAERIRRLRRKEGEQPAEQLEENMQDALSEARKKAEIREWDGLAGDIVVGRHTWKEYIRGLHEGWLGPLDSPVPAEMQPKVLDVGKAEASIASPAEHVQDPTTPTSQLADYDASPTAALEPSKVEEPKKPQEEENKPKKKEQLPPFNATADYSHSTLSPHCPPALDPSTAIPLPHLLGFFNFPIRMYRFLNRRHNADEIGRQTAAAVLAVYRPYKGPGEWYQLESGTSAGSQDENKDIKWEQERLLQHEEPDWHKSARERKDGDERERVWLDDMVLDTRIAERMRKFELDNETEEQIKRLASRTETGDPWWKSVWPKKEKKINAWEGLSED